MAIGDVREVKAATLAAAVTFAYMGAVLASGLIDPAGFGRLLAFYIGTAFALWIVLLGVVVAVVTVRAGRRSGDEPFLTAFVKEGLKSRWQRDRFVSLIWPPIQFAALLASFNAFKQMVLPVAGFGWDPMLAAADKALFLGHDPWRVTHALFASPAATALIDGAYHGWFVPMSVGLIACAVMPASTFRLRTQYLLSYVGVWIGIGSVAAFAMPSAGPCFYGHFIGAEPSFAELMQRLHWVEAETGTRLAALNNQAMLLKLHGADKLIIGGGISAMPSVHNALALLFALAAFRLNRAVGLAMGAYAALIWIGSIHLGWHYALDGLVAAAMTVVVWKACGRIAAALDRDAPAPSALPAAA